MKFDVGFYIRMFLDTENIFLSKFSDFCFSNYPKFEVVFDISRIMYVLAFLFFQSRFPKMFKKSNISLCFGCSVQALLHLQSSTALLALLRDILIYCRVFARVNPKQKVRSRFFSQQASVERYQ